LARALSEDGINLKSSDLGEILATKDENEQLNLADFYNLFGGEEALRQKAEDMGISFGELVSNLL
jgi:hypothetical protein